MTAERKSEPFQQTVSWPDGDIVLRSADGVDFRVHSLFLRLSSTVFADMLAIPRAEGSQATSDKIVDLSEDTETVDILLRWIYPVENRPQITSIADFKKYVPLAMKYDIRTAIESHNTSMESSQIISSNPCQAFAISIIHGITSGIRAAARQIIVRNIHILDEVPIDDFGDLSWRVVKRLDTLRLE